MRDKSELRAELGARRAVVFDARPDAGAQLAAHFLASIFISDHTVVAGYMPFRSEIDPLPLMRFLTQNGAQLALPRMNSPSHLWGGVGVGGGVTDTFALPVTNTAPPSPGPFPTKGGRGEALINRVRRLRASPTKYEQKLWDLLRIKRPDQTHWRRQVAIGGYVYDFGCHRLKLLVEVDGGVHRLPKVQARDQLKSEVAIAHGYRLIRLQNEDVLKIETAQFFDKYAAAESPSHLWGGVGVGGGASDLHAISVTTTAPHSLSLILAPSPQWGRGDALTFHLCDIDNQSHFQTNKHGILEPVQTLPTATPTILLVPLLGFDRQGNRIGYGKGYYDRAIAGLGKDVTTIGLAFAEQEVPKIPTQPHDQRLDWIITQNEAYRVPS